MLCQIATHPDLSLAGLSKYRLFDLFVHFLLDREVRKRGRDPLFALDVRRQFNRALAFWLWSQGGISTVTLASVPAEICHAASDGVRHDYDDTGLRKELTAGCLIEKGATGTIYFGHRSLQEFLVAEELIATDFRRIDPVDKSASLWTLGLITPEVGSFLQDAANASPETKNVIFGWFDILKDLKRRDMPRSGMRFFMEAHAMFVEPLARLNGPWFIWLKYFAANQAVEFSPKTPSSVDQLSASLRFLAGNADQQAATLSLFAEALSRQSDARIRLAQQLLAKWLDPEVLLDAVQTARKLGSGEHHYISMDKNLALWAFLYSAKIETGPLRVTVDLRELRKRVSSHFPMGFADEQDEHLPDDHRHVTVEVQPIYRAWGIRPADLEKVRPFFTDDAVRRKILPLEIVVRAARDDREKLAPPGKPQSRQTLGLKKRGASGK
jgi:hypothetical protein